MSFEDWVENTYNLSNNPPLSLAELKEAWNKAIELALNECVFVTKKSVEGVGTREIMDAYSEIKKLYA